MSANARCKGDEKNFMASVGLVLVIGHRHRTKINYRIPKSTAGYAVERDTAIAA